MGPDKYKIRVEIITYSTSIMQEKILPRPANIEYYPKGKKRRNYSFLQLSFNKWSKFLKKLLRKYSITLFVYFLIFTTVF